eukprot:CAMPEP_0177262426 /NCGR_PEP_ID=MMETSP0367-20130122/60374_1 /TAXON_ID=447022 ORGANISM="Scrippsiella hangoei-like, Strain SHHI-4" /NCGR_SAMPLE_ID=MMETSP0367 /ASSEMBLY_ACC=CAM_ASM_000362 /LENGTH=136 /DNA_ID=CAMNT_0018717187 /DNA_START=178 /DNA_END=589 /DNA_ORIENTATION=+
MPFALVVTADDTQTLSAAFRVFSKIAESVQDHRLPKSKPHPSPMILPARVADHLLRAAELGAEALGVRAPERILLSLLLVVVLLEELRLGVASPTAGAAAAAETADKGNFEIPDVPEAPATRELALPGVAEASDGN